MNRYILKEKEAFENVPTNLKTFLVDFCAIFFMLVTFKFYRYAKYYVIFAKNI